MVRAAGSCNTEKSECQSPEDVLAAVAGWIRHDQTSSFMPTAPGGGTENVGVVVAVNDMLVQVRIITHCMS